MVCDIHYDSKDLDATKVDADFTGRILPMNWLTLQVSSTAFLTLWLLSIACRGTGRRHLQHLRMY